MPDSQRGADTLPPAALRGLEIAQLRGCVMNDVEPPRLPTLPFPVAAVVVASSQSSVDADDAPMSEAPASLAPREVARVLASLAKAHPSQPP